MAHVSVHLYLFKCDLCDALGYVGYTKGHLHTRVEGHRQYASSIYKHYSQEHNTAVPNNLLARFNVIKKCTNKFDCLVNAVYSRSWGTFTRKEDNPSAKIILKDSFALHAKTRLLGSTFHLVYMQDCPSTFVFGEVAKQVTMTNPKFCRFSLFTGVDDCLLASICHYKQLDISNTATEERLEKSLPPADSILWALYFENNIAHLQ